MEHTNCRSCGNRIMWCRSEAGNLIPIDPDPVDDGNIVILDGIAKTLAKDDLFEPQYPDQPRYISHFATCPQAGQWRKKKGKK